MDRDLLGVQVNMDGTETPIYKPGKERQGLLFNPAEARSAPTLTPMDKYVAAIDALKETPA